MNAFWPNRGGEMGERLAAFDWSRTPLGPLQSWPPNLRIVVDLMLASAQPSLIAWGPELTALYNNACIPLLGGRHASTLGMPLAFAFPVLWRECRPLVEAILLGRAQHMVNRQVSLPDRPDRPTGRFSFSCTPLRDERGVISGLFCAASETTAQLRTEIPSVKVDAAPLPQAEARLHSMLQIDTVGVVFFDLLGGIVDANDAFLRMTGFDRADLQSGRIRYDQLTPPEWAWKNNQALLELKSTGKSQPFEKEYFRKDGSRISMLCAGQMIDEHIAVEFVLDTTERKLAEARVAEAQSRLRFLDALGKATAISKDADAIMATTARMLGQHLGVAVCAYADMDPDQDGFTIRDDWSAPGSPSIVGHYSLADFGTLAVRNLSAGLPLVLNDNAGQLPPHEAATFLNIGLAATICMPLVKQGRLTALMAVHDKVPRVWTASELGLVTEVTERCWAHIERVRADAEMRQAELHFRRELEAKVAERTAALQQSEANIRAIFDTSHLYQGLLSKTGIVLHANATSLAGIKSSLDDVVGRPFWDTPWFTGTPGMTQAVRRAVAEVAAGKTSNISMVLELPTGTRSFDFSMRPVLDEHGAVSAMVPEAVDTTARLAAEQVLHQAQKMEAIGNLTGGIAHDFNNLLMAVLGSLELLRKRMPPDPSLRRLLDNAVEGAKRGSGLTSRMLSFARRQDLKAEQIDLQELVGGMTELLQRSLGPTIRLETKFPPHLPMVFTDPNQLETALLNLAVNARDAMHGDGKITIIGCEDVIRGPHPVLHEGKYVCLLVSDSGEGMSPDVLARATEPFFTTKGIGKGTGLGLSMVQGFAEQSGGALVLHSVSGQGTTAQICFPAVVADEAAVEHAYHHAPHARSEDRVGPLRILVVDDDALVLMNTVAMLEDLGHTVSSAMSAQEALHFLGRAQFDLLITDHAMPQITGTQLAAEARARWPQLLIMLATGYAELPLDMATDLPRLAKPFSQADLAEAVGVVVGDRSRRV